MHANKPDFTVEIDAKNGIYYYTPENQVAYDWCRGFHEHMPPAHRAGMAGVPMFGRSYMFAEANPRANKLRGYLKSIETAERPEGFVVHVVRL